jgi:hypothetical protein
MQDAITEKALRDTGLAATVVLIKQVCTDNLNAGAAVMKSAQDGA